MLRRVSTLVGVSFVIVVGAWSNTSASAFETIKINQREEEPEAIQSSFKLSSVTAISTKSVTEQSEDRKESATRPGLSSTPGDRLEAKPEIQADFERSDPPKSGSIPTANQTYPTFLPQPSTTNPGHSSENRIEQSLVMQRFQSDWSLDQRLLDAEIQVLTAHNSVPLFIPSPASRNSPGYGTQQSGDYLRQIVTLFPNPIPQSISNLDISVEYSEISPGIYVPHHYLHSAPEIDPPEQPSGQPEELPPLREDAFIPGLPGSSPGLWEYPLYPLPTSVPITSSYGWRIHPIHGTRRFHQGTDLATPTGTPVLASTTGWVEYAGWMQGYGYTVIVRHESEQVRMLYAHLSSIEVSIRQSVLQGEIIAQAGSTGVSTGPHLHFEIQEWNELEGQWVAIDSTPIVVYAQHRLETGQSVLFSPWQSGSVADTAALLEIRVALKEDASSVVVGSSTTAVITALNGEYLFSMPSGALTLSSNQANPIAGESLPPAFFLTPTDGGYVFVEDRWYRGKLLVAQRPTGLILVNWVPIEDYLTSVVGSEAYPDWNQAALQAQAIAARSYALAQVYRYRNDPWYEVSATPRHQAYRGVEREFASTHQAVSSTQGMILLPASTFREPDRIVGGVVEAQYASTQTITNAYHDGFGMSQWGAAQMAAEGHDYLTILRHYYPDTHLTQLW